VAGALRCFDLPSSSLAMAMPTRQRSGPV
jgi:hypothetical protein